MTERFGSMDDNEYFTRRVRVQFDEFMACLNLLQGHIQFVDELREEMVAFVSEQLGHRAWVSCAYRRHQKQQRVVPK